MFRICSKINNFNVYAVYRNPGHNVSLYDCILDSIAGIQSVDDYAVFVFVGEANSHHSERLESVSCPDRHGRDALDFCILSGCEQLVRCPTHIAVNRLDLVMTDTPDIVDVIVGTPLGTSYHCFISCVLIANLDPQLPMALVCSELVCAHRKKAFFWTPLSNT